MKALRADELMIGDLVYYNPNVFIEDEYEPTKKWEIFTIRNGEDIDCAINDCYEPIPLTPEILEKNGFRMFQQFLYYPTPQWSLKELSHVQIILKEKDDDRVIEYSERDEETVLNVQYVHELQHALRLCGSNKEIKL